MATLAEVRDAVAGLPVVNGFVVVDERLRLLATRLPAKTKEAAACLILLGDPDLGVEPSVRPPMQSAALRGLRAGQGAYQAPPVPTSGAAEAPGASRLAEQPRGADGAPTGPRVSIA